MKRSSVLGTVFLAVTLCCAMSFYAWGADPIKIGIIGPMQFTQGEGHWNGATMAAEEINKAGGISVKGTKRPIELIKVDSNEFLSIPDATNAVELAISRHKVDFLLGGFRTEAVLVMQDIAMDNKKIFIGCGAAHPELCDRVTKDYNRYKYWFRLTPINSKHLVAVDFILLDMAAKTMTKELDIPKIKVAIVAEKAAWADPMVDVAEEKLPKMGMEVVGVWRPSPTATDTSAELSAIQRAGAHIIFTTFSSSVGIPFAKQAGELKIPAPLVGINVEAQKDGFWEATGGKGNYGLTVNTYARVKITDKTIPFFDEYKKRFKEAPNYTAGTHDAIYVLKAAIEKAGTLEPDKLVPELEKTDYESAAGRIVFDKDSRRHVGTGLCDCSWGPNGRMGKTCACGPTIGRESHTRGLCPISCPPWVVEHYKKK